MIVEVKYAVKESIYNQATLDQRNLFLQNRQ